METTTKKLYEAMFLVDSAQAGSDWDGTMATINRVLERAEAEVVTTRKWADRKLAYEIEHKNRGTYVLCFFKADPSKISGMEKDVLLSEKIMRAMITSTEGRSEAVLEKDIKGEAPAPRDQEYDSPRDRNERSDRIRSVPKTEAEDVKAAAAKLEAEAAAKAKADEEAEAPAKDESAPDAETAEKATDDAAAAVAKDESDESVPDTEKETPEKPSGDTETAEETPAS
ncbi:MAG: 30S ribosomal protein S6 [Planctomycetes bacterium]|nr:30S ribosomal protein S6 [Planctomycetota bacterium]